MIKRWMRRGPIHCWVIKQIDEERLHLCETGRLVTQLKRRVAEHQLARGEYRGGVQIGDTGIILNSALFAALVPWPDLSLDDDYRAHWQGRTWEVSRVPQRCWAWEGRLVAERLPGALPAWQSTEDVTHLRERADDSQWLGTRADFRPANALEDPDKDIRDAITRNRARQAGIRVEPGGKTRVRQEDEIY